MFSQLTDDLHLRGMRKLVLLIAIAITILMVVKFWPVLIKWFEYHQID
jgi:hypothetical protein